MNNSYIGYNDLGTFGAALIIPPNAISTEIHNTIMQECMEL